MSSDKTFNPGAGNVVITLGGEEYILRPTLDAAMALSRHGGGIRPAITRVVDLDLDTIVAVIRLGVGRDGRGVPKNLDRLIWENGLLEAQGELITRCVEYLSNLARGGRPPDDGEKDSSDEDPTTKPQLN